MNVIDLFSGVGGFSSGFRKAGFDVIVANEIDPMIADSYCKNHLGTLMINQDIEKFADNIDGIIEENLRLCKNSSKNKEASNVYLVIHPQDGDFKVHVINLKSKYDIKEEVSFTYK